MDSRDFARCLNVLTPILEGQDVEIVDALAKLADPHATIDRSDAMALGSELLLRPRRDYVARGGKLGTWGRAPRY